MRHLNESLPSKGPRLRQSGGLPNETIFCWHEHVELTFPLASASDTAGPAKRFEEHFVVGGSSRGLVRDSHIVRESSYIQNCPPPDMRPFSFTSILTFVYPQFTSIKAYDEFDRRPTDCLGTKA